MKHCPKCDEDRKTSEFYRDKTRPDGLQHCCKVCSKKKVKKYYKKNSVELIEKAKQRYLETSPHLKQYGLTQEDYDRMLAEQKDVCAICGKSDTDKKLAVDHDHKTGAIRGLLCSRCNTTLGRIEDSVAWLDEAKKYLGKCMVCVV